MSTDPSPLTPTRALQQLEQRRHILERLVAAARTIEALKHSMAHMLAQGDGPSSQTPHLSRFIEALGQKVRNLSDAEVQLRLNKLDRRQRELLAQLQPLIEQIQTADTALEELPLASAEETIGTFRRLAQTGLALRGLLARRGLKVPELRLPFDQEQLQRQLQAINGEEQKARRSVIRQVREIGGEIRQLLDRQDLPPHMHKLLEEMLQGLQANLAHLKAGKSVLDLPLDIEATAFIEPAPGAVEAKEHAAWDAEPTPAGATTRAGPAGASRIQEAQPPGKPPSLPRAVWLWVCSPWDVSWRDIREGRYPRGD